MFFVNVIEDAAVMQQLRKAAVLLSGWIRIIVQIYLSDSAVTNWVFGIYSPLVVVL